MSIVRKSVLLSCIIILVGVALPNFFPSYHDLLVSLPYVETIGTFIHKISRFLPNYYTPPTITKTSKKKRTKERIFTVDELKSYDGQPGSKGLYLAILGQVFDVKKGKKHYGPGGGYEFFTGKDGTRAFISGDFTEDGLIDDVTGLSSQDFIGIDEWLQFYKKDYKYVGKLIGRYFDKDGNPTEYNMKVMEWVAESYSHKDDENIEKQVFPPCNSEWFPETGTRLWCTKRSGGIARNWVGVPRKFYSPGKTQPRCACIKDFGPPSHDPTRPNHNDNGDLELPNLAEYPGCPVKESTCQVTKNAS